MAERDIPDTLARALDGTVISVRDIGGRSQVVVEARGRRVALTAVSAGEGGAAEVRRILDVLADQDLPRVVLVARRYSAPALETLRESAANWAESAGGARIATPDLLVIRDRPASTQRTVAFRWSPSALLIAEALLTRAWHEPIRTADITELTEWSLPRVNVVLQAFDKQGWTAKRGPERGPGAGRELVDAVSLLTEWSAVVARQEGERRYAHSSNQDPMAFIRDRAPRCLGERVPWAAGGWPASEILAPYATAVPAAQIHVDETAFFGPLTDALEACGLVEVDKGGRFEFISTPAGALRLGGERDGVKVASAARVYADLLRIGGRAEDVAEHLRREVIVPLHEPFVARPPRPAIATWTDESHERLRRRIAGSGREGIYDHGSWSVAYWLREGRCPSLGELADLLGQVVGRETGWQVWNPRIAPPQVVDGKLEGWASSDVFPDPSHADFWRADPEGRFFLLRGYEEDGELPGVAPSTTLDVTLPIWRIGECLLHAHRVAERLGARRVEVLARWTGLEQRELRSVLTPQWTVAPGRTATTDSVECSVDVRADAIDSALERLVRALVDPLFEAFHAFTAPDALFREAIYGSELAKLRQRV